MVKIEIDFVDARHIEPKTYGHWSEPDADGESMFVIDDIEGWDKWKKHCFENGLIT